MPKDNILLPFSITTFPQPDEEIFLFYSKSFEHGPGIQRTGKGSPYMHDKSRPSDYSITDPRMQRDGTWYLGPEYKDADIADIRKELKKLEKDAEEYQIKLRDGLSAREEKVFNVLKDMTEKRRRYRARILAKLQSNPGSFKDYESQFHDCHPDYEIVGMQGCGNLSMNDWYVAFINSDFTEGNPTLIYLPSEAKNMPNRTYTCLVKWKQGNKKEERPLTIEKLSFNIYNEHVGSNIVTSLNRDGIDITHDIQFAVHGTQLVENGRLVSLREKIIEIGDIRHVYKLINVNPRDSMWPRRFFGKNQYDDVWFGERHLLQNVEDVRRLALTGPVKLDCNFENMGADIDEISQMLLMGGYNIVDEWESLGSPGEFKKIGGSIIEVYLPRNVYAYSMMGVDSKGNVSALAVGGKAGQLGQPLEGAAQNMLNYGLRIGTREQVYSGPGIKDALLIDQGNDVFQKALRSDGDGLQDLVRAERSQMRSVFIFARKKPKI
jgi:hypothetical protein